MLWVIFSCQKQNETDRYIQALDGKRKQMVGITADVWEPLVQDTSNFLITTLQP